MNFVNPANPVQKSRSVQRFFLAFAAALSRLRFTQNLVILLIKPTGIGLSKGNLTVPFRCFVLRQLVLKRFNRSRAGIKTDVVVVSGEVDKITFSTNVGIMYLIASSASGAFLIAVLTF